MSKTYTGGYRLVSLAFIDLALASTAVAVAGLGDALGVKSRKRIVLTDIVVSGEKKNDVGVEVEKISGGYAIKNVYGYDLEIVIEGSTLKATPSVDHITASEIDSGSATAGQVLTADGSGGVTFANPAGGGTQLYRHVVTLPSYPTIYKITCDANGNAVTDSTPTFGDKKFSYINDSATPIESIADLRTNKPIIAENANLGTSNMQVAKIYISGGGPVQLLGMYITSTKAEFTSVTLSSDLAVTDVVTAL